MSSPAALSNRKFLLSGLDGSNPLGLLAALGVLNALSDREPTARLAWVERVVWVGEVFGVSGELVDLLDADRVLCADDEALQLTYGGKRDLRPPPTAFRSYLETIAATSSPADRRSAE